jgi:hypothetical protein
MQFRLADVAYLFALLAVCFGVFGVWGVIFAAGLAYYWWFSARRPPTFRDALVVVLFVMMVPFALAMLSPIHSVHLSKRNTDCIGHLQGLAKALTLEAEVKGLPQAIIRNPKGQPFRSWRVSILPRVELRSSYERYKVDEPWNSPKNQRVFARAPDLFVCANDPPVSYDDLHTNYFAVVGDQAVWPEGRGRRLEELTDGLDQTILVLEAYHLNAQIGEPRDLTFDEALLLLTSPPRDDDYCFHRQYASPRYFYRDSRTLPPGVYAAFADGAVRFLPVPLPEEMARAMLTANAGDEVDWDEFERLTAPQLDYEKIYATIAFAAVALWPARRLLRRRPLQ